MILALFVLAHCKILTLKCYRLPKNTDKSKFKGIVRNIVLMKNFF